MGLIILENKSYNNKVYLFLDDHSNTNYCGKNEIFISELFEHIEHIEKYNSDTVLFLLEEPLINSKSNIMSMWNDSIHIVKFKNYYYKFLSKCSNTKVCNVFPIDIRLCIFDISLDEFIEKIKDDNYFNSINYNRYDTYYYFRNLLYIFDLINEYDFNKLIELSYSKNENIHNVKFVKKVFDVFKNSDYYMKLKSKIELLTKLYITPNRNIPIQKFLSNNMSFNYDFVEGYPFVENNNTNFIDMVDKILNSLLEFYTIILTNYMNYKVVIINTGFFHGLTIQNILKNIYNYNIIYKKGLTEFKDINKQEYKNCLIIDKNIFKIL